MKNSSLILALSCFLCSVISLLSMIFLPWRMMQNGSSEVLLDFQTILSKGNAFRNANLLFFILLAALLLISAVTALINAKVPNEKLTVIKIAVYAVLLLVILGSGVAELTIESSFTENSPLRLFSSLRAGLILAIVFSILGFICSVLDMVLGRKRTEKSIVTRKSVDSADIKTENLILGIAGALSNFEFPIRDQETITIGRNPSDSQIVVNGKKISRLHCMVQYHAAKKQFTVVDHSANGIYLINGDRIEPGNEAVIPVGTKICLGDKDQIIQLGE